MTFEEAVIGVGILCVGFVPTIIGLVKLSQRTGRAQPRWLGLSAVGLLVMSLAIIYWGYVLYS